ncbi:MULTISPECIES: methylglyoxal synthase [unclassified Clostridioides]|uniref:methylglyoxal synthase n=1 Tax=unclassified Clostridioides TaxID=2635829 RepID=UPI001D1010F5|nr:methylglyoxal synthase [Clostridioides sp. ZZV15-6388]MCC0664172.1 methylglyoxal synthase [Clostridioides sp. ZZV15-6597]MCC0666651.1 methylglyoxal synthase [Clostridioides sp. ZZV14-6153]MCC0717673.1 methylglyoxal synthase [Clostridioides sp. ZZV14-6105]MCC0729113.1 methylglyoxal synthase [Clostridioides sp. ZZV14-6048]MCC0734137.1 methylglyoxal synthase [Clostridioides sp. ZZV14-6009]MCC0742455.1 methylglyoxal synthase [Clostridioides sp. ZZV14-6044]MCC0749832.1 methylglyoxal synthase [
MNIALVAHDQMKNTMVGFCIGYEAILKKYGLYATGTTGKRIMDETELKITRLASGPLGGDQQIGSLIVTQEIDLVIFLRDPLTSQPHETDIQALIRLCDVYHVPIATNLASAEIFIKALDRGELSWREVRKNKSQRV